ncbi:palmitoleoyl-protein carboxylesterase notum1 isoform X2 [Parasteatoda tepidariorum]|uniref:palmitoleoyl-protein carboxylesterase notum1 isoform X2 n=1 Tax=Parasteatoda tepidariorum TaxID=114398 RepID=UPI00077FAEAD|nr:palmitoleoyl-protein carboxylesterase notum1 isoform X2 [Parasteatoda tepidariorum]
MYVMPWYFPLVLFSFFARTSSTQSSQTSGSRLPELKVLLNSQSLSRISNPGLDLIRQLVHELHECRTSKAPAMRKVMLSNKTVTCNDGSPAGYYIRESRSSKRWIIFLEGGWYCFDEKSCNNRWTRSRNLMSSSLWPDTRSVGGIMSPDPEENPYWWDANQIFLPYCSSDSWSGAYYSTKKGEFSFLGSLIVLEVVKDLLTQGLFSSDMLLLAGSSAGGTGVLLNLDRVSDFLKSIKSKIEVRGLVDSGWFLDNEPYEAQECMDPHTCAPVEAIKRGSKMWDGQVPKRCQMQYTQIDNWRCYFGYRIYATLQSPVFVFQWLFDEAQMTADNVGAPVSKSQWDYIHKMGIDIRTSLDNVSAVFAPACISHTVLSNKDWRHVKINKVSLPQALRCWELQAHEHNHHHHHPHHHLYDPVKESIDSTSPSSMVGDMPTASLRISRKKLENNSTESREDTDSIESVVDKEEKRKQRRKERKRKRQNRNKKRKKNSRKEYLRVRHRWTLHEDLCYHWLVDECTWPQCNRACPRLHDPFTGEELDFIELLKSFGLDMSSVANALGIDLVTLNDMDHDTLLQLLTQQTNK